jgi:long-chain fatty acid transport protein
MKKLSSALVLLAALAAGPVLAAGYNVDVQSGRATAMATAVTANSIDPSAVLFNPADIIQGEKTLKVQIGDTLIIPNVSFSPAAPGNDYAVTRMVPPFQAYAVYGITKDLSVGAGVFSAFGLKIVWPDNWIGAQLIQQSALTTFNINPEVAYRIGILKIGAGVQIVRGTVDLIQKINFLNGDPNGQGELGGGAWGIGGNVGVEAELLPGMLSVAATYRSRVKLDFDGDAHFSNVPVEFQGSQNGQIHDQAVKASATLPDWVTVGVSVSPIPTLRINADVDYFAWQLFHDLTITFEDPTLNRSNLKNWSHGFNYHLGGEFDVTPTISVRAGVMYDPTPSPGDTLSPDVPDADRINIAAGIGYHSSGFSADLGYQYIKFLDTESTYKPLPGTYGGNVHVVGLSLGYALSL